MGKENGRTVVIIGSGGREAALAHKYSQSPHVDKIIAIPGNDMMQETSQVPIQRIPLRPSQTIEIATALTPYKRDIAFVDIAQEDAVRGDLSGQLHIQNGIAAVGPDSNAGKIEYDKRFARTLGDFLGLPQPAFDVVDFKDTPFGKKVPDYYESVLSRVSDGKRFVKANGLAEGKGVIPAQGRREIEKAIAYLRRTYPDASRVVLIEEGMVGEEFSAFAISNGIGFKIIGYAQDHKQVFDNDKGPNTGGMGAVSNPLLLADQRLQKAVDEIFEKTFQGLKYERRYKGVLYLGGMKEQAKRKPSVVEFNARWGDPEAQVLVPGLEVDLFELSQRVNSGDFKDFKVKQDGKVRVAVTGAAKGYPQDSSLAQGKEIKGISAARKVRNVTVYGAGVAVNEGRHYVNGGRLFYVVGEGSNVVEAREQAYEAIHHISIDDDNLHFRTDIGHRDVERLTRNSV